MNIAGHLDTKIGKKKKAEKSSREKEVTAEGCA